MSAARLFISYSHKDADWLEKVQTHFAILRMQGQVTAWSDKDIQPGDHWSDEIATAVREADVAVLLVSANFIASDFIMRRELPDLLAIRNGEQPGRLRRILPLILEPCMWKYVPALKELEVRPKGHELSAGSEHQIQADLADFAQQVIKLLFEPPPPQEVGLPRGGVLPTAILGGAGYATLEIRLAHCEWSSYRVELIFTWSGDRKWDFMRRYGICLDLDAFARIADPETYARELRKALFPDAEAWGAVTLAKERANEKGVNLRVRICIEASARDLHSLNWEKLTALGGPDDPLAYGSTALARYALGYGASARAALARRNAESSALLLAATADLAATGDSALPEGLAAVADLLSGAGIACTVGRNWYSIREVAEELRRHDGIDHVCLLVRDCPPAAGGTLLCSPRGLGTEAADQARRGIGEALDAMERPPRLMVIAPADTEAPAAAECWPWFLHLAHDLVERGVLGVLTLQGNLDQATWLAFLAPFFGELIQHGQIDQAARAAREQIAAAAAPWAPVLVARLRTARLWYEPRLMDEARRDQTWKLLLARIAEDRCTPILGPGIDYRIARFRQQVAMEWADRYQYPLAGHEQVNLAQVAQYVAATRGDVQMEEDFTKDLRAFALKRYKHLLDAAEQGLPLVRMLSVIAGKVLLKEPCDPHVILASLPFSTYITANFNNFLADALRRRDPPRAPTELVFSAGQQGGESVAPTAEQPLIYHLFGRLDDIESLVLTEDDYFDFLIEFWRERERIPAAVRRALASSSLLFLGFNLNQWDFRVLFRSLLKEQSSQRRRKQLHVAVQIDPDDDQITDPDRAREYLEKYFEGFSESDINIYWGSCEDFLDVLQRQWQEQTP